MAKPVPTLALLAILGFEMLAVAKVDEGVEAGDTVDHHVTAAATVTAVRAAKGDIFLAPKADTAGTAIASA